MDFKVSKLFLLVLKIIRLYHSLIQSYFANLYAYLYE